MNILLRSPSDAHFALISLVNYNHNDNNLSEILVHVYSGSIVNNRPKNGIDLLLEKRFAIEFGIFFCILIE